MFIECGCIVTKIDLATVREVAKWLIRKEKLDGYMLASLLKEYEDLRSGHTKLEIIHTLVAWVRDHVPHQLLDFLEKGNIYQYFMKYTDNTDETLWAMYSPCITRDNAPRYYRFFGHLRDFSCSKSLRMRVLDEKIVSEDTNPLVYILE